MWLGKSDLYELEVVLEHIAPRVIYKGVLSTGWVRLDLWCKAQNHPFDNSSSNIFSLFQLETNNGFHSENMFLKKKLYKNLQFLTILFCYKVCVIEKKTYKGPSINGVGNWEGGRGQKLLKSSDG